MNIINKRAMGLRNILYFGVQETQDAWFKNLSFCHRFGERMWMVDVKHLIYQLDKNNPNHEDIVSCTDYFVGYHMKGAQALAKERKI
jgi:hypothetical protein